MSISRRLWSAAVVAAAAIGILVVGGADIARATDIDTFHGQSPARLLDTRAGGSTIDGASAGIGAISGDGQLDLTVVGRGGVPASGVGAVALNITVTGPAAGGYLTVWPAGATRPTASNLNFVVGQTVPNMVVVQVGASGRVSIFNGAPGSVQVIADVLGWFPTGASFSGLTPARLLDSRVGAPTIDGVLAGVGQIGGTATIDVPVLGRGGVPAAGVGAVALNVTATNPRSIGYVTVFPTGQPRPTASNLNFVAGRTVPNMVIVQVGAGGKVSLFNGATLPADLIVDVLGWFPTGASFTGLAPARLMDTREGVPTIDSRFSGHARVAEAETFNLAVAGRAGVPFGAGAVALNVTVTSPTRPGYLTIHPQGAARPTASNLNFEAGQTIANMVLVPLGGSGQISIHLTDGAPNGLNDAETEVLVDVMGYFPNPTDPPTMYGNPLVLRSNGVGGSVFGDNPASVLATISPVLGASDYTVDQTYPDTLPSGRFFNPDSYDSFTYRYSRHVCFLTNSFCALFGGSNASTLTFVGWDYFGAENARLIDTNGLGMGTRGSNLPGAIASIASNGCYSYGTGTAASGIKLGLVSDGLWFSTVAPDGTIVGHMPPQSDVVVESMWGGDEILYTEGDC